jgi:hypothetical protein
MSPRRARLMTFHNIRSFSAFHMNDGGSMNPVGLGIGILTNTRYSGSSILNVPRLSNTTPAQSLSTKINTNSTLNATKLRNCPGLMNSETRTAKPSHHLQPATNSQSPSYRQWNNVHQRRTKVMYVKKRVFRGWRRRIPAGCLGTFIDILLALQFVRQFRTG